MINWNYQIERRWSAAKIYHIKEEVLKEKED